MLYQFHWQVFESGRTEFVEQSSDIDSPEAAESWWQYIREKYQAESAVRAEDGMVPFLCSQDDGHFLLTPNPETLRC